MVKLIVSPLYLPTMTAVWMLADIPCYVGHSYEYLGITGITQLIIYNPTLNKTIITVSKITLKEDKILLNLCAKYHKLWYLLHKFSNIFKSYD